MFTLPLLTLELHMLGKNYLKPEGRPLPDLDMWDAAALSIGTVLAGALFRLVMEDLKQHLSDMYSYTAILISCVVLWCGASAMFAVVCLVLVGGLQEQVADTPEAHDVAAIMIFQLVQVGYPVVSATDWLRRMHAQSPNKNKKLS